MYIVDKNNTVKTSNGTSYSGPTIAGAAACLWGALPNKTNQEIRTLILESSDLYLNPDNQKGYGIPDFSSFSALLSTDVSLLKDVVKVNSLVTDNTLTVQFLDNNAVLNATLYNALGVRVSNQTISANNAAVSMVGIANGIYVLELAYKQNVASYKIIVQK